MQMRLRPALSILFVICLPAIGCSGDRRASETIPVAWNVPQPAEPEILARASALSDSGYRLLDAGKHAEAIAMMRQSLDAHPSGKWGHYNLACALSRAGEVDAALAELVLAVRAGWDNHFHLNSDPDLAPLRSDARYEALLAEARTNAGRHLEPLSRGLPSVDAGIRFPDADSLGSWVHARQRLIGRNSGSWNGWEYVLASADLEAKRIAAAQTLGLPDSAFDAGLERVRAMCGLMGLWEKWGPVATGTLETVRSYLSGNPASSKADEARYAAGIAAFCRENPEPEDASWVEATRTSLEWFDQIPAASEYAGGVAAWRLLFDLRSPGADTAALKPRVQEFASRYQDDDHASRISGQFFREDLMRAIWPIQFASTDLRGNPVGLEPYRGKVLLLCYWATW